MEETDSSIVAERGNKVEVQTDGKEQGEETQAKQLVSQESVQGDDTPVAEQVSEQQAPRPIVDKSESSQATGDQSDLVQPTVGMSDPVGSGAVAGSDLVPEDTVGQPHSDNPRSLREPAIVRSRERVHKEQLRDSYWVDSASIKREISVLADLLSTDSQAHSELRRSKKAVQRVLERLTGSYTELNQLDHSRELMGDYQVILESVEAALAQYRVHYPKEFPDATSSTCSNSSIVSARSHLSAHLISAVHDLGMKERDETLAVDDQIAQLKEQKQAKLADIQQQIKAAEEEQKLRAEEAQRKAQIEAEEAKLRAQQKEVEAKAKALEDTSRMKRQLEKQQKEAEEKLDSLIQKKKQQREELHSYYREKQNTLLLQSMLDYQQLSFTAPPTLPHENLMGRFLDSVSDLELTHESAVGSGYDRYRQADIMTGDSVTEAHPTTLTGTTTTSTYMSAQNVAHPQSITATTQQTKAAPPPFTALIKPEVNNPDLVREPATLQSAPDGLQRKSRPDLKQQASTRPHQDYKRVPRPGSRDTGAAQFPLPGKADPRPPLQQVAKPVKLPRALPGTFKSLLLRSPRKPSPLSPLHSQQLPAQNDRQSGALQLGVEPVGFPAGMIADTPTTTTATVTQSHGTLMSACQQKTTALVSLPEHHHGPHHRSIYNMPSSGSPLNPYVDPFVPTAVLQPPVKQPTFGGSQGYYAEEEDTTHTVAQTLVDAVRQSRLPVQEPTVFTGDPLLYSIWRSTFDQLVETQRIPNHEKLIYLERYLDGAAKQAVQGFFLMRTEGALREALDVLERRFGNPFVIAQTFREKLDTWPTIKANDGEGLRRLADFLRQTKQAREVVGQMNILDDPHYQRQLLGKAPEWIRRKWSCYAHQMKTSPKSRYPNFSELTDWITLQAEVACDTVFGTGKTLTSTAPSATGAGSRPKSALATEFTPQFSNMEVALLKKICHPVAEGESEVRNTGANEFQQQQQRQLSYPRQKFCIHCKMNNHTVADCRTLLKKTLEERKKFFRDSKLCFGCGRKGHLARVCVARAKCQTCQAGHPTVIHPETEPVNNTVSTTTTATTTAGDSTTSTAGGMGGTNKVAATSSDTVLSTSLARTTMVVPVMVSTLENPATEVPTYALLDTMSSLSFVSTDIAEKLKTRSVNTSLRLNTMTGQNELVESKAISGLQVRSLREDERIQLPLVHTTENLSVSFDAVPTPEIASRHSHLKHLAKELSPILHDVQAGLLLGYDCPSALMPKSVIQGMPYAVETALGWSIIGDTVVSDDVDTLCTSPTMVLETPLSANVTTTTFVQPNKSYTTQVAHVFRTHVVEATPTDVLHILERDFIERDVGMRSQDEVRFMKILEAGITLNENGKYEMPLPFKEGDPTMPDNRPAAIGRALNLRSQLQRNDRKRQHYVEFMEKNIQEGYAEKVPEDQVNEKNRWYIPHHGVYHERKPDKIRVVFDCSHRYRGACINDCLLQGPDLMNSLVGVLCRFRQGKIGFSCDIQSMFHQFYVSQMHRDYLRFLWWEDGNLDSAPKDYRMKVHIFGATSSPACANFGLRRMASDHEKAHPESADFLKQDFYVDDGLGAENEVDEAVKVLQGAMKICESHGMRLHKVVSNSLEFLSHFPASERRDGDRLDLGSRDELRAERTLGLQWRTDADSFTFTHEPKRKPLTRRGMLSALASLYDPLGLIAPVVLHGRVLLQALCREKASWDDPPSPEIEEKWRHWTQELERLHEVQISRSFIPRQFGEPVCVELHHFSDASETGYGQCSYLRLVDERSTVHCSLVMAKSRVAPLKALTIPRLELQAATLSVKIAAYLEKELSYESISHHFWTDSEIVLAYISNTSKKFHVFVANRVSQILDFTSPSQWSHVATECNPADLASRGVNIGDLLKSRWYLGPEFLWERTIVPRENKFLIGHGDVEVKDSRATLLASSAYTSMEERFQRFSKLTSLLRAVGLFMRVTAKKRGVYLTVVESWEKARMRIVSITQRKYLSSPDPQMSNTLKQLNCKWDEDLLRVAGRRSADLPLPLVLPKDSHVALLVVRECHDATGHAGRTLTINKIRSSGYWIVGIRRVVSAVIRDCYDCRRHHGAPLSQRMADLPDDRVTEHPPFLFSGIDCFGPFLVKDGRKTVKRYALLVTCLATRAVHIETLEDMSADAFINAIRRVIAVRGHIQQIRCDRGTNFVGASRELKKAWSEISFDSIKSSLLERFQCEWIFNPPAASHMGGVWERLIRSARRILNGLMTRAEGRLTTSSLPTLLYEVMAVMNSRPLSVESLEDPTGPLPLTPNHILTGRSTPIFPPPGSFEEADVTLRKQWRRVQCLADQFWERWRAEYVSSLQRRRKWCDVQENLAVGDIVLLQDDNAHRSDWRLAKVETVLPSDDGLVRRCLVRTPRRGVEDSVADTASTSVLERPVAKLILIHKSSAEPVKV